MFGDEGLDCRVRHTVRRGKKGKKKKKEKEKEKKKAIVELEQGADVSQRCHSLIRGLPFWRLPPPFLLFFSFFHDLFP
jgi:hypothetical protein